MSVGVLFAPDRGEASRRKLRERFAGVIDGFGGQLDKANDVVQETMAAYSESSSVVPEQSEIDFPPKKDQGREVRSSANSDPINTLGREEFLKVAGIGPALADTIISGRPYSSR